MSLAPTDHSATDTNRTPIPRTHSTQSSLDSVATEVVSRSSGMEPFVIYIVTDTCFPSQFDFNHNKGTFHIDSVHTSLKNANARAKKIMYEDGPCVIDNDKVIEETKARLYTGIGIGGIEGDVSVKAGGSGCFARKCQVEKKMVDDDSEFDDGGNGVDRVDGERKGEKDGDVEMG